MTNALLTDDEIKPVLDRIPTGWGASADISRGWYRIVRDLNAKISELVPDYEVHQVKEKFGGLRYYIGSVPDELQETVSQLIREAEEAAARTCEVCGEPGEAGGRTWIQTLCPEHQVKFDEAVGASTQ